MLFFRFIFFQNVATAHKNFGTTSKIFWTELSSVFRLIPTYLVYKNTRTCQLFSEYNVVCCSTYTAVNSHNAQKIHFFHYLMFLEKNTKMKENGIYYRETCILVFYLMWYMSKIVKYCKENLKYIFWSQYPMVFLLRGGPRFWGGAPCGPLSMPLSKNAPPPSKIRWIFSSFMKVFISIFLY